MLFQSKMPNRMVDALARSGDGTLYVIEAKGETSSSDSAVVLLRPLPSDFSPGIGWPLDHEDEFEEEGDKTWPWTPQAPYWLDLRNRERTPTASVPAMGPNPVHLEHVPLEWLLRLALSPATQDEQLGDLLEKFSVSIQPRFGRRYATFWLCWQTSSLILSAFTSMRWLGWLAAAFAFLFRQSK